MEQTIQEKIKQRRRQMLVHSYLYYEKDVNIISDAQWSKWAKELAQLQKDYPKEASQVEFSEMFQNWNGSTGAYLKFGEKIRYLGDCLYYHCRFDYDEWQRLYGVVIERKPEVVVGKESIITVSKKSKKKESGARSLF